MCFNSRAVRRLAVITRRGRYSIGVTSDLLRRVLTSRIRVINEFIRGRRIRELRRRLCRNRATSLASKGRLCLLIKDLAAGRRHVRGVTSFRASITLDRAICHVGRHRFFVGGLYLILYGVASLRVISRFGATVVTGLVRSALRRDDLSFAILARGDGLFAAFSNRVRVVRGRIITVDLTRAIAGRQVIAAPWYYQGVRARDAIVRLIRLCQRRLLRLLSTTLCLCYLNKFMSRALSGVFSVHRLLLLILMYPGLLFPTFNARARVFIVFSLVVRGPSAKCFRHAINRVVSGDAIIASRRCEVNLNYRRIFGPLSALGIRVINEFIRRRRVQPSRRRFNRFSARAPSATRFFNQPIGVLARGTRTRRHAFRLYLVVRTSRRLRAFALVNRPLSRYRMVLALVVYTIYRFLVRPLRTFLRASSVHGDLLNFFAGNVFITRRRRLERVSSDKLTQGQRCAQYKLLLSDCGLRRHKFSHAILASRHGTFLVVGSVEGILGRKDYNGLRLRVFC